jgi:hypothetical protein
VTLTFRDQDPRDIRACLAKDLSGRPRPDELLDAVLELVEKERRQILKKKLIQTGGILVQRKRADEERIKGHYHRLVRVIDATLDMAKDASNKVDKTKIDTSSWTVMLEDIVMDERASCSPLSFAFSQPKRLPCSQRYRAMTWSIS